MVLKVFALDRRFDVIAFGSMLGIIMHEVSSYPIGYVESLYMRLMFFKEFLRAKGYRNNLIQSLKEYFDKNEAVPTATHEKLNELFYIIL